MENAPKATHIAGSRGARYGQLADPFGDQWSVSMRVKMSRQEAEQKRGSDGDVREGRASRREV